MSDKPAIVVHDLEKRFVLHAQGKELRVLRSLSLEVWPGECVVLDGPSGAGKSTLLRVLYGNYCVDAGSVRIRHEGRLLDLAIVPSRTVLDLRRRTLAHVSQFLRVIPRVPVLALVADRLRDAGLDEVQARERARDMLHRVALPQHLWSLPPATFSGGEQQRVNIARGLAAGHPILLVDEPTASLDAPNAARITSLLRTAREEGTAIVAICHDATARAAIATRLFAMPALDAA